MSDPVQEYIQSIKQEWQIPICERLHEVVHASIPEVQERIQYSKPHYLKNGKYLAVTSVAKGGVSFTIFNATSLQAPDGFFQADSPPERKTIKILKDQTVDYDLLGNLLQEAAKTL